MPEGERAPVLTFTLYGLAPGQSELDLTSTGSPAVLLQAAIDELQRMAAEVADFKGQRPGAVPPDLQRVSRAFEAGGLEAVSQLEQQLAADEDDLSAEGREMLELARHLIARRQPKA